MLLKPPPGGSGGRDACDAIFRILRPAAPDIGLPVAGFFLGIFLLSLGSPPPYGGPLPTRNCPNCCLWES